MNNPDFFETWRFPVRLWNDEVRESRENPADLFSIDCIFPTGKLFSVINDRTKTTSRNKTYETSHEKTELWIVPMMNPDGVDLRNWGYHLETKPPEKIEECSSRKDSPNYAGDKPFSEPETQAVRDLLLAHQNIKIFLDYHSGSAGFMQGAVGCATGRGTRKGIHPSIDAFCNGFIDSFAERVTDPHDTRPSFLVTSNEGAADIMRQQVPFYIKPFVPSKFFEEPGTSINYSYDQLNMAAIGIELFRGSSFFKKLPGSQRLLIENQVRGILLLLDIIANKHGH